MRFEDSTWLREQAKKCRRLAATTSDEQVAETLTLMARDYERKATEIGQDAESIPPSSRPPLAD